ncbi:MAG: hypothetical protein Kow0022_00900 [Phycisphaerales bacterium]
MNIYSGSGWVPSCASVGRLILDGRCYVIGEQSCAGREIAQVFCRMGYSAWYDGSRIVVYTSSCRKPQFYWESCDYNLESSWRGDCLVLCLRAICHTGPRIVYPPPRSCESGYYSYHSARSNCDTGFGISFRFSSERSWYGHTQGGHWNDRHDQRYDFGSRGRDRSSDEREQRSTVPAPDRGVQVVDRRRPPSPYPVAPARGDGGHDDTARRTRRP